MKLRPIISVVATVATFLGLTGLSSPAFAAAPTVTIDSSASGCGSVTNVTFDGATQAEYMENYWSDGTQVGVIGEITCNGIVLDVEWMGIDLYADEDVTLTVPDLSDLSVSEHSGSIESAWGSDCLSTQYKVGVQADVAYEEWGDPNSPSIRTDAIYTLASDGTFTVDLIDGVSNIVSYPAQSDSGGLIGESDSESGQTYAAKCATNIKDKLTWFFDSGETINLENKTAQVNYLFDYPEGFDSGACSAVEAPEFVQVIRGQDVISVQLTCGSYQIELESDSGLIAGQSNDVTFTVPPFSEVTISGTIDFAHDECATSSLQLVNFAPWDWSADGTSSSIEPDGSFTYTGPLGPYRFVIQSNSDDSDFDQYLNDLCAITSPSIGFVSEDTEGVELVSDTVKVAVTMSQPLINESDGECSLYYPGAEGVTNAEARSFAVATNATRVPIEVWCGSDFYRQLSLVITSTGANTATASLTAPNVEMVTITGSITLPKGYPASKLGNLSVNLQPEYDPFTGAQGAWVSTVNPVINTARKTYTVDLPVGNYLFGINALGVAPRTNGCYVDSYYPGGTIQFAQPVTISTATSRAPTLELLPGGRINGKATFDEAITAEVTYFEDAVYNMDGTSYAWWAGDGTMVQEDGDFMVYQCLPAGQYYYRAGNASDGVKSQYFGGVTSMENATPITIPKGGFDAEPIEMRFTALDAGQISGTVVDEAGESLSEYTVVAFDQISESFMSGVTNSDGEYVLTGLNTPGEYTLLAFSNDLWSGTAGTDYAYFPSNTKEDAVVVSLTKSASSKSVIDVVVAGGLPAKSAYELWPWFENMNVAAPAVDFIGVTEALLDGSVTVDTENVEFVPDNRHRIDALADWSLDIEVNFNSIDDNVVGAYGFTGGEEAAALGDVAAADDRARVFGTMDLVEGLNFVTVTGNESGRTVAVPIVFGALAPTMLTVPTQRGSLKAGKKVTGTEGFWVAGPEITRTTYQWMACSSSGTESGCKAISGAKKLALTIPAKVKGKYLALKVTATNGVSTTSEIENFGRVR